MSQQPKSTFVVSDPSEILRALVGLKDVRVLHYCRRGPDVELVVEQVLGDVACPGCRGPARVKERPVVRYVDLPVFGVPMRLAWRKHRMACARSCGRGSFVVGDHRIAAKRCRLTTRAAKWATAQVGTGRTVSEVAKELGCDWHTVNDAVTIYGNALSAADRKRLNATSAIGLDETAFVRTGRFRRTSFVTTVADVEHHCLIDVVASREFTDVARWLDAQDPAWKQRVRFGALDMSATYAAVYGVVLPGATQVVDPFHAVKLANACLDAVRRRVQAEQTGHRGRRDEPLYRARRALLLAEERLDAKGSQRLSSLLALGDPDAEVAIAYRVKERLRDFYATREPGAARELLDDLHQGVHAPRSAKAGAHHRALGRQVVQLPPGQGVQRAHRDVEQPHKAREEDRLRLQELRQLQGARPALRGQAELASARLDRGPLRAVTPSESEEPAYRP